MFKFQREFFEKFKNAKNKTILRPRMPRNPLFVLYDDLSMPTTPDADEPLERAKKD